MGKEFQKEKASQVVFLRAGLLLQRPDPSLHVSLTCLPLPLHRRLSSPRVVADK
jgi:hypothetical protein